MIEEIRKGQAIPRVVYVLGNALRHHAGLTQTEGRARLENPFVQRFVELHSREFYKIGYSTGSTDQSRSSGRAISAGNRNSVQGSQGDAAMAEAGKTIFRETKSQVI